MAGSKDLFASIKEKGKQKNENKIKMIDITLIDIVENIRKEYDDIEDLKESIKIYGVQSPIKVIETNNERYKILFGHRRYLATKKCAESDPKFSEIPCIIENYKNEEEIIELQLIENVDRDDLKDFEKGEALNKYKDITKKSNSEIAERFGKKEKWVRNILDSFKIIKNIESSIIQSSSDEKLNNISDIYKDLPATVVVETKGLDLHDQKEVLKSFKEKYINQKDVRNIKKEKKLKPDSKIQDILEETKENKNSSSKVEIVIDDKRYILKKDKINDINNIIKYIETNSNKHNEVLLNMFKDLLKKLS